MQGFEVTAWDVKGKVDYDKLCKEFGCTVIQQDLVERIEKVTGVPAHPFLRRNIFYAHRDLELLLDLYEKGEKFYLYTGAPLQESAHGLLFGLRVVRGTEMRSIVQGGARRRRRCTWAT